jgi:ATP-dependent DNA helicase DinG
VAAAFAPGGALALAMPDFEARAGQVEMASAVSRVFEDGGVLLAEAGTGTGKTLAYLVPAILSRERVLISTGTKNLQEQIYFKDIPALRDALGIPFTATYMKGRANYLCVHKLDQLTDGAGPASHDVFLPIIREWSGRTDTGDRAELQDLPEDLAFWQEVSATADTCLGTECPRYDDCFVTRMRQRAAESDVVIVNHHLLCADAAVRQNAFGEVIPAFTRAILDEAHQLEDIATQYFGFNVSTYRLEELARDVERMVAAAGIEDRTERDELAKAVQRLRDHAQAFFIELAFAHRGNGRAKSEERVRATAESLGQTYDASVNLTGALDVLESTLALLRPVRSKQDTTGEDSDSGRVRLQADRSDEDAATLARRAGQLRDDLRFLLRGTDDSYVYFVEFRGRGTFLRASPIDVSTIVRDLLLDRMHTTVLTSATLTVDGGFHYIRARLGIGQAARFDSPPSSISGSRPSCICRRKCRIRDRRTSPSQPAARSSRFSSARRGARSCSSPATRRCGRCRRWPKWRWTIRSWRRARRRDPNCSTSSDPRRTRCCSPRRASGRALMSLAKP